MTKLGAHITGHPRYDYANLASANQALVVAVDDGGVLGETMRLSGGHTVTVFRDTTIYLEAPGDINTKNPAVTWAQFAYYWYEDHGNANNGGLKKKWLQNPADFYTITNEQGGNDPESIRNLVDYEREVMKLANADGLDVCVLNLAGGSPGDFTLWQSLIAPFIIEAWAADNIYGRHVYGGNLVDAGGHVLSGQPSRPIEEIAWLNAQGHHGGLAITECGLDGGVGFAGVNRFVRQMTAYEMELRPYGDIIGVAMWNLGPWQGDTANWQNAIPAFVEYMEANPTPPWEPGEVEPPPPGITLEDTIWLISLDSQTIELNEDAALQSEIFQHGYIPVGSETWIGYEGKQYALQPAEALDGRPRHVAWVEVPHWDSVQWMAEPSDPPTPPPPPPPPPVGGSFDLAEYIRGDGRMYEVRHAHGPQETFQTQRDGDHNFYQVKNSQWEHLFAGVDHIWRGKDTSPGPAPSYASRPGKPRYYHQYNWGESMARWCPARMEVGESWASNVSHIVQFYYKKDCEPSSANSGSGLRNGVKLAAHYDTFTTDQGGTVEDVILLEANGENMYYGKGWGLIAWGHPESESGSKASGYTGELHSGRPDLVRERGCFS